MTLTQGFRIAEMILLVDLFPRLPEPRVYRGDNHIESCKRLFGKIEPAVRPDIDLGAFEDPESGKLLVRGVDELDLRGKPFFIQSMRNAQPLRVIGDRDI